MKLSSWLQYVEGLAQESVWLMEKIALPLSRDFTCHPSPVCSSGMVQSSAVNPWTSLIKAHCLANLPALSSWMLWLVHLRGGEAVCHVFIFSAVCSGFGLIAA
eukprot:scaffold133365_cov31-Prasinocladus_malaysianus.AAC.3